MKHYLLKAYMHDLENIICVFTWRTQENYTFMGFLNQARTCRRPARTWFLEINPVQIVVMHVCVCVCLHPRLLITSGVMWHDMKFIWLVKQVLQLLYGNCSRYR